MRRSFLVNRGTGGVCRAKARHTGHSGGGRSLAWVRWLVGLIECAFLLAGLDCHAGDAIHTLHAARGIDLDALGLSGSAEWLLADRYGQRPRLFRIPSELPFVHELPSDQRDALLAEVRRHEANREAIARVAQEDLPVVGAAQLRLVPEYRNHLSEVAIAIDGRITRHSDPLALHEPILKALPPYTRIHVFVDGTAKRRVADRLRALGLSRRSTVIGVDGWDLRGGAADRGGGTAWIHDTLLVGRNDSRSVLLTPLAFHFSNRDVTNDLGYLKVLSGPGRDLLRTPLFFRAGNMLAARRAAGAGTTATLVFVGERELNLNATGYANVLNMRPRDSAFLDSLAALTGVQEIAVMPNSEHLFHIDLYLTLLDDGLAALLTPLDPENLPAADRRALARAREYLERLGFQVVSVPTVSERILAYQSPANAVPFLDRETGQRKVLVPEFPDRQVAVNGTTRSLNAMVAEAYRGAGVTPVPVTDHFFADHGNTHCVLLVLN